MSLLTESTNSVSKALENTVILREIITLLPANQVKEVRKVSSVWEPVANLILGKRTVFSFQNHNPVYAPGNSNLSLAVQLLRRVYLQSLYHPDENDTDIQEITCPFRFVHFVLKYQSHIKEFYFHINYNFGPAMKALFESVRFTSIAKIHIKVQDTTQYPGGTFKNVEFQISNDFSTLKEFMIRSSIRQSDGIGSIYRDMTTQILKVARNLEKLIIHDNFTPDLSSCRILKCLEWLYYPYKEKMSPFDQVTICEKFDIQNFVCMLTKISTTLEDLTVGILARYDAEEYPIPRILIDPSTLPVLSKLTSLSLPSAEALDFALPNLTLAQLPGLKRLKLNATSKDIYDEVSSFNFFLPCLPTRQIWTVQEIEVLQLRATDDSSSPSLTKIWQAFPNLRHLKLTKLGGLDRSNNAVEWDHVKQFFRNLHYCPSHVSRLTIDLNLRTSFSDLMDVMDITDGCHLVESEWHTSVTVINRAHYNSAFRSDPACIKYRNAFKTWQPNLTFDGFETRLTSAVQMSDFIKENKLDVKFVDNIYALEKNW
ncbi:uncharacterized protein LOC110862907 isoform X2 [Folsomia candida]|uniref:uncharacterized protein LOC110862907 isoform X2 n=1 Tax=Folsomia candida TaxID=158441 RepID=UPI001604F587|nr:uncharacterized protein LOC110862907 isoform X2 [Folsomia candida]